MMSVGWEDGITYRNVYEGGVIGGYICANRKCADEYEAQDRRLELHGKRIGVIRITAKNR